jgi:GNAT superfamily N-acetyltransferase
METVQILDYKPSLKHCFTDLVKPWLLSVLGGKLEKEDEFTIHEPGDAYLQPGGFVFFAMEADKCLGTVALKRLDEKSFEFAKLIVTEDARNKGVATKLIRKCITRCRENSISELWLQTTMRMPAAHKLYYKLGFEDQPAPPQMDVLRRTEKIMRLKLT